MKRQPDRHPTENGMIIRFSLQPTFGDAFPPNASGVREETIGDFASSLRPLGEIKSVALQAELLRGGMTFRVFRVVFASKNVVLTTYTTADGKIEQFLVEPAS